MLLCKEMSDVIGKKYQILRKPLGSDLSSTGLYRTLTPLYNTLFLFCYCAHQALHQNTMDDNEHHICNVIGFLSNFLMHAAKWFMWYLHYSSIYGYWGRQECRQIRDYSHHICNVIVGFSILTCSKMVQCGISTIHTAGTLRIDSGQFNLA